MPRREEDLEGFGEALARAQGREGDGKGFAAWKLCVRYLERAAEDGDGGDGMTVVLVVAVVVGLGIGIGVGLAQRRRGGKGQARRSRPSPREPEGFRAGRSGFDPKTGSWKTWDGTPYGAIDTLLADADGDAADADFDGDGLPG
jgi:hypothetical protein